MALLFGSFGASTANLHLSQQYDYGTGHSFIDKTELTTDDVNLLYPLLHGVEPETFDLDYDQYNGTFTMDANVLLVDEDWTLAWGLHRTREQARWFIVLLYASDDEDGITCRHVVGRLILEDESLPASGNEVRVALARSLRVRGCPVELKGRRARKERNDHKHF